MFVRKNGYGTLLVFVNPEGSLQMQLNRRLTLYIRNDYCYQRDQYFNTNLMWASEKMQYDRVYSLAKPSSVTLKLTMVFTDDLKTPICNSEQSFKLCIKL